MASLSAFDRMGASLAYAATKADIVSLVKYLAPVLAEGIRYYRENEVPMKRFATPKEITALVAFLCSRCS